MSIYEFDEEKYREIIRDESVSEGIEIGKEIGMEFGKELGLKGIVNSLKAYITNLDDLYEAVIKNEGYENITKEQVKQLL